MGQFVFRCRYGMFRARHVCGLGMIALQPSPIMPPYLVAMIHGKQNARKTIEWRVEIVGRILAPKRTPFLIVVALQLPAGLTLHWRVCRTRPVRTFAGHVLKM